jgi:hypothetical protein
MDIVIQTEQNVGTHGIEGREARGVDHDEVTGNAPELINLGFLGGDRGVGQRAVENQGAAVAEQLDPEP